MTQMPRKQGLYRTKRRSGDYGQADGQQDCKPAKPENGSAANNLIADMAKGFVEAQAKISGPNDSANREMLQLLQKISSQLDNVQKANSAVSTSQPKTTTNQSPNAEQGAELPAANGPDQNSPGLHNLFNQLLSAANQNSPPQKQQNNGSGQNQTKQLGIGGKQQKLAPQDAAQALSQAQYELSQELEASLQKLKQVIAESEKLADRISDLIENDQEQ